MSLDFYLHKKIYTEIFSGNATHNLTEMWNKSGVYDALYMSDNKKAGEIVDILRKGYDDMIKNREEYEKFNPSNGWGSYDAALRFLRETMHACEENPDADISVSK